MAVVIEDSEVQTSRQSAGLFYAARSFASKAVSALGIFCAGKQRKFIKKSIGICLRLNWEWTYSMRSEWL